MTGQYRAWRVSPPPQSAMNESWSFQQCFILPPPGKLTKFLLSAFELFFFEKKRARNPCHRQPQLLSLSFTGAFPASYSQQA